MYYIVYKDSYFCGYEEGESVWLDKDKKNIWYFKTLESAKNEAKIAKLKLSKCTFKKL